MSEALRLFRGQTERASALIAYNNIARLNLSERQIFYHANVAAWVAAWDTYLNKVTIEAITRTGDPLNGELQAMKALALESAARTLKRFNTPNFDNSRRVLIECVGWDPIAAWNWPRRMMTWQLVQERLNEILKVRHSFAHGLPIPVYGWLPNSGGNAYLNKECIGEVQKLLRHLAAETDAKLKSHMENNYGTFNSSSW